MKKGLEWRTWLDPIEDFVRQHGRETPRWAVVLTYQLSLERFARNVLPALSRRGRTFRCALFVDQGSFESGMTSAPAHIGASLNIHPVRCRKGGVFHPKLVFLRAGRHVRICFGSANATEGGMGTNLEIWTSTDDADLQSGLQRFMSQLTTAHDDLLMDPGAQRTLSRALMGLPTDKSSDSVWTSMDESFQTRIRRHPERNAKHVTVLSPMYASDTGLKLARAAIPAPSISLYTTEPASGLGTSVQLFEQRFQATAEDENDRAQRTLHAKAYVFENASGHTAWLGSANFTSTALTRSLSQGGNVEVLVRTQLPADEHKALMSDLGELFQRTETGALKPIQQRLEIPKAKSHVLACELIPTENGPALLVHASIDDGEVVLVAGANRIKVKIRSGRGRLQGRDLEDLLGPVELESAQALFIGEQIGREQVPVVVNIPHVPSPEAGHFAGSARQALDVFIDDLLGRIRIPQSDDDSDGADESLSEDESDDLRDSTEEAERKLDEVKHQGELDQLAVKAALVRRLINRLKGEPAFRNAFLAEAETSVARAAPSHLLQSIEKLFQVKK